MLVKKAKKAGGFPRIQELCDSKHVTLLFSCKKKKGKKEFQLKVELKDLDWLLKISIGIFWLFRWILKWLGIVVFFSSIQTELLYAINSWL